MVIYIDVKTYGCQWEWIKMKGHPILVEFHLKQFQVSTNLSYLPANTRLPGGFYRAPTLVDAFGLWCSPSFFDQPCNKNNQPLHDTTTDISYPTYRH